MKLNSNTIKLEKEQFTQLESIIKKIASENSIKNVEAINISLDKDKGIVKFKKAWNGESSEYTEEETLEATQGEPTKEFGRVFIINYRISGTNETDTSRIEASDEEQAISMLRERLGANIGYPEIISIKEEKDVEKLQPF